MTNPNPRRADRVQAKDYPHAFPHLGTVRPRSVRVTSLLGTLVRAYRGRRVSTVACSFAGAGRVAGPGFFLPGSASVGAVRAGRSVTTKPAAVRTAGNGDAQMIPAYKARRRQLERAAFVASIQARTPDSRVCVGGGGGVAHAATVTAPRQDAHPAEHGGAVPSITPMGGAA
jgi:hypothetical protein